MLESTDCLPESTDRLLKSTACLIESTDCFLETIGSWSESTRSLSKETPWWSSETHCFREDRDAFQGYRGDLSKITARLVETTSSSTDETACCRWTVHTLPEQRPPDTPYGDVLWLGQLERVNAVAIDPACQKLTPTHLSTAFEHVTDRGKVQLWLRKPNAG